MDAADNSEMLLFEGFGLDRSGGGLYRFDEAQLPVPIGIGWRALEVLSVLIDHRGTIVSRKQIIDAVWPGAVVEENNLTIQISALRRVLDQGGLEKSCIQTVPGRGYRFIGSVTMSNRNATPRIPVASAPSGQFAPLTVLPDLGTASAPRLSFVVLPFSNLGGTRDEEYLADAITDDLTTDLSRLPGALVIAHHSAATYKGKPVDIRQVGEELGVRYVVEGSVRKLDSLLRVNARLIAAETNTHVWADRFDHCAEDRTLGQEEIASRLRSALGLQVLNAESVRSIRERPDSPDASDLLLRAWSTWCNPPGPGSLAQAAALFEQALQLDASLVPAMCGLADVLINQYMIPGSPAWASETLLERAADRLSTAGAIEPDNERFLFCQGYLLRAQARLAEASAVLQRVIELLPNDYAAYRQLGFCRIAQGRTEEALPLLERSIRLDPRSLSNRFVYLWMGYSLLLLGRDEAALPWLQRALAGGSMSPAPWRARCYLYMASAYALVGNLQEARRALGEANRLWPFATVCCLPPAICGPRGLPDPVLRTQIQRVAEGLRRAGLRDHAEEDADSGVAPSSELHIDLFGHTPTSVPGAVTIRTRELTDLLRNGQPVLIDVALESWGWSLPGAIGLQGTGHGSEFSEAWQHRLRTKMHELSRGDPSAPIVTFCTNSERFTGYNLALRLVALGYSNVFWYRGGREAWMVSGLPETELSVHDW